MSYEYLKGMGVIDAGSNTASQQGYRPPASGSSGGTTSGGTTGGGATFGAAGRAGMTSSSSLLFRAGATTGSGAQAPSMVAPMVVVAKPLVSTAQVPSGSVTTKTTERTSLKEWCRQTLGQNSAFYQEKLKNDPGFTYMNANVLARFRNSSETVSDMLRGSGDSAVTVGDVTAFKSWWSKCHKDTYVSFTQLYKSWGKSETWIPLKPSTAWKQSYKATGACPNATQKKALFEYKASTTAAALLQAQAATQQAAKDAQAAQAAEALAAAAKARADAEAAQKAAAASRAEAEAAAKQLELLQKTNTGLQGQINTLNSQLASASSADVVASLQAQIQQLTEQLFAAQAQVPIAQAGVQQAEAVAAQTEAVAVNAVEQATQVEAVADQLYSEVAPWYIQYKWYLLGGAVAVAAAGYWWYTKKYKPAAAMAKNGLPVPTSARRPSGLRGNPCHGNPCHGKKH